MVRQERDIWTYRLSQATAAGSRQEYQLLLAPDLEFLPKAEYAKLVEDTAEARRMIAGLIQYLSK